jgi:hypothetical protein
MVYFTLYLLALCSPLVVFAVISIVDDRKRGGVVRRQPQRLRRRSKATLETIAAVLEAQFVVAPGTAVREAQQLLSEATGQPPATTPSQLDQEGFALLLERLSKTDHHKHVFIG